MCIYFNNKTEQEIKEWSLQLHSLVEMVTPFGHCCTLPRHYGLHGIREGFDTTERAFSWAMTYRSSTTFRPFDQSIKSTRFVNAGEQSYQDNLTPQIWIFSLFFFSLIMKVSLLPFVLLSFLLMSVLSQGSWPLPPPPTSPNQHQLHVHNVYHNSNQNSLPPRPLHQRLLPIRPQVPRPFSPALHPIQFIRLKISLCIQPLFLVTKFLRTPEKSKSLVSTRKFIPVSSLNSPKIIKTFFLPSDGTCVWLTPVVHEGCNCQRCLSENSTDRNSTFNVKEEVTSSSLPSVISVTDCLITNGQLREAAVCLFLFANRQLHSWSHLHDPVTKKVPVEVWEVCKMFLSDSDVWSASRIWASPTTIKSAGSIWVVNCPI